MQSSKANNGVHRATFSGVRYEHLLAGISGGVASTLILHPLDLLKVRFAVPDTGRISSSGLSAAAAAVQRPQYTGLGHATSVIWRSEGVRGFYKGVTPNLWGAGSAWGLYFLFYNILKSEYQNRQLRTNLGPGTHMIAAAQAGVFTLLLTNPIWVVKTRLCLQYDNVSGSNSSSAANNLRYKGMVDALAKTYKTEGIRGLYKGLVPGLFGVSHGALQFMAYEELKLSYNAHFNRPANSKLTTGEYLMCAALSKLFAAVTTYPYQVMRSRMQDQHAHYANLRACIAFTWRFLVDKRLQFFTGFVTTLAARIRNTGQHAYTRGGGGCRSDRAQFCGGYSRTTPRLQRHRRRRFFLAAHNRFVCSQPGGSGVDKPCISIPQPFTFRAVFLNLGERESPQ